jgi:hypothetical protein
MSDDALLHNVTLPTDEQVERAAKLAAVAHGDKPERWQSHAGVARVALVILLNRTKVEVGA